MITPMSRVELICMSDIRSKVVESLHARALLHMEEVPLENEDAPEFLDRVNLEGDERESYVRLEEAERSLNEVIPLLTLEPGTFEVQASQKNIDGWSDIQIADKIVASAGEIKEVTRRRAALQDSIDVLDNYKNILEQVAPALGGSDVKIGRGTRALVLTGDVKKAVARIEERLEEEIGTGCSFHKNQTSKRHLVGLISFPESRENDVNRILSQEGVSTVDMSDESYADATLSEVLERIDKTIAQHHQKVSELEGQANTISRQVGSDLLGAKAIVADRLARLRVQAQFAQSKMITVIHGWTPSDQFAVLEQAVESEFPGQVEVNRIEAEEIQHTAIPTLLKNPPLFRPFEVILKIFSPPTYGTVDPTIMIACSFILFYGFIVGDFVYGIAILLFAKWLGRKFSSIPEVVDASTIGVYMGISSMVFGVLFGEYAGEIFGIPPLWFHRGHEVIRLLIYALYLGIVHVVLAVGLGVYENYKHGHMTHAIEKLGMLFGVCALITFAFGFFDVAPFNAQPVLIFAGIMLVVGAVLIFKTMGPMMGAVGVLEILSLGGNILSYARLMALGLAAISIADIANELLGTFGWFIGGLAAILIHIINIGISLASPTIHALRLNFVEFLPKFYAPEGRVFNPFKKEISS